MLTRFSCDFRVRGWAREQYVGRVRIGSVSDILRTPACVTVVPASARIDSDIHGGFRTHGEKTTADAETDLAISKELRVTREKIV